MINHNAIEILKSFAKKDILKFRNFIINKNYNKSDKLVKLYKAIIKYHGKFDNKNFTPENIYAVITNSAYNATTFRVLMHKLLLLLNKYLILENFEEDELHGRVLLLNESLKRNLPKNISKIIKDNEQIFNNSKADYSFYYNRYTNQIYSSDWATINNVIKDKKNAIKEIEELDKQEGNLIALILSELISNNLHNKNVCINNGLDESVIIKDKFLDHIDVENMINKLKKDPVLYKVISLKYFAYKTYSKDPKKKDYITYKKLLKDTEKYLSLSEINSHYSTLFNYCLLNAEKNKSKYYAEELLKLYKYFLQNKLYSQKSINQIPVRLFRGIMYNVVRLKQFDWLEHFLKAFSKDLPEIYRDSMYNLGYALFYYGKGDHYKSLKCLDKVKIHFKMMKYDTIIIKLKIYFEYDDPELLINLIHSFKNYMDNDDRMKPNLKVKYNNLIKYVNMLISYKEGNSDIDLDEIQEKIKSEKYIILISWLDEMITKLKKGAKQRRYLSA